MEQKTILNRDEIASDEIAKLAWHLWQQEGCQTGRDLDYWLRAEQELLVFSEQGSTWTTVVNTKTNGPAPKETKATGQPAQRSRLRGNAV